MNMLTNVPLMAVPLIAYNLVILGFVGDATADPWAAEVLSMSMVSGEQWQMNLGDLMIALGLFLLFFEIVKATRVGTDTIIDHLLSTVVFIAYLIEFMLVGSAANSVFFLLMAITFVDVVAGFTVSIRSASRDVTVGGNY